MNTSPILVSIIAITLAGGAWAAGTGEESRIEAQSAAGAGTEGSSVSSIGMAVDNQSPMAAANYQLRASDIIGKDVQNAQEEEVGEVDDLIITPDDTVVRAVVSVGGILGIGDKLVTVPYSELQLPTDSRDYVVYNATKEQLEAMPEFSYKEGERTGREYRDEAMKSTNTQ